MEWLSAEVTVNANVLPLPLAVAREWVRESGDNDMMMEPILRAAVSHVEGVTGLYLSPVTVKLRADSFPVGRGMELPRGPVRSVTSVYYRDATDALVEFASANYRLIQNGVSACVELTQSATWGSTVYSANAVEVTAELGYSDWNAVPRNVQTAVLLLAASLWANREATAAAVNEMPFGFYDLLANHFVRRL